MTKPPSRLPGHWLLAIGRIVFTKSVLQTVAHQTIADLRDEVLQAGADRSQRWRARYRGYVAFWSLVAMAPVAFRDWPAQELDRQTPRSADMTVASKVRWFALLLVVGLVAGNLVSRLRPVLYQSSMVIQVVRPLMTSVTSDESTVAGNSDREDRQLVINAALSRTRVEQMVRQFDLYGSGQAKNVNDATLALARNRMNIREEGSSGKIMVSFIDPVPGMAQRVAEHLGAIFIDGATQERSAKQEGTLTFFEQQVDYAAARLAVASEQLQRDGGASLPKRMELEVLQSSYKQLLAKREEARMARDLNSRSLGERFRALDPANLPQEPVGPTRLELTLIGGTLGLLVAWIIVTADIVRRSLKNRREFMPATN